MSGRTRLVTFGGDAVGAVAQFTSSSDTQLVFFFTNVSGLSGLGDSSVVNIESRGGWRGGSGISASSLGVEAVRRGLNLWNTPYMSCVDGGCVAMRRCASVLQEHSQQVWNAFGIERRRKPQMLTRKDRYKYTGKYCNQKVQLWLQPSRDAFQQKETKPDCFGWEKHQTLRREHRRRDCKPPLWLILSSSRQVCLVGIFQFPLSTMSDW